MTDPSFVLDGMLGSLARWLRIMGYDSLYVQDVSDRDMLELLQGNQRFLLTRDRQLSARAGERGLFVESDELDEQLVAVTERFSLDIKGRMTRCSACNGELLPQEREEIRADVPEGTWTTYQEFWRCAACGKIYWRGAHWKNIERRLDALSIGRRRGPH